MGDSKTCSVQKYLLFFPFHPFPLPHPPPDSCQPPRRTASKIFPSNSGFLSKVNRTREEEMGRLQFRQKTTKGKTLSCTRWKFKGLGCWSFSVQARLERHSYSHPKLQFSLTVLNASWTYLISLWFNLLWAILTPHRLEKQGARETMHVHVYSGVWVLVEESEV